MNNYCVVERDLAHYERRIEEEYRIDAARDIAIETEYRKMLEKPLSCWIDETPKMRLTDACCEVLPLGAEARRHIARIDLESVIRAIAEFRVEAFAEQCRIDHATGNDL